MDFEWTSGRLGCTQFMYSALFSDTHAACGFQQHGRRRGRADAARTVRHTNRWFDCNKRGSPGGRHGALAGWACLVGFMHQGGLHVLGRAYPASGFSSLTATHQQRTHALSCAPYALTAPVPPVFASSSVFSFLLKWCATIAAAPKPNEALPS